MTLNSGSHFDVAAFVEGPGSVTTALLAVGPRPALELHTLWKWPFFLQNLQTAFFAAQEWSLFLEPQRKQLYCPVEVFCELLRCEELPPTGLEAALPFEEADWGLVFGLVLPPCPVTALLFACDEMCRPFKQSKDTSYFATTASSFSTVGSVTCSSSFCSLWSLTPVR